MASWWQVPLGTGGTQGEVASPGLSACPGVVAAAARPQQAGEVGGGVAFSLLVCSQRHSLQGSPAFLNLSSALRIHCVLHVLFSLCEPE